MIVLALVVAPAVVFAVARTTAAPATIGGWSAYPPAGAAVSTAGVEQVSAEKAAIRADVAKWKRRHPGGSCQITPPDSAQCTTADGMTSDLVVLVDAIVVSSNTP